jgi:hypothetical protein
MNLNSEQRRILEMLAGGGPRGYAEAVLRVHEFDAALLAELVKAGLARRLLERVQAGGRPVDVARLRITPVGRQVTQDGREPRDRRQGLVTSRPRSDRGTMAKLTMARLTQKLSLHS